jgi:hypothetical protein
MTNQIRIAILLAYSTIFLGVGNAQEAVSSRLGDFVGIARETARSDKTDFEKSAEIYSAYKKRFALDFSAQDLRNFSDTELSALFDANSEAVFITRDPQFALNMEKILSELRTRKKTARAQFSDLYQSLIRVRDFDRARTLASREKLESPTALPEFRSGGDVKEGMPAEWVVPRSGRVAELRAADLSRDWQVIVVSHPRCHFSRRAMLDIYADASLKKLLEDRTKWIAPQDGSFEFDLIQKWNNQFPGAEISVVHLRKNWPVPNFTETPVFYFLSGGKVVKTFAGWPKEGNKAKLMDGLQTVRRVE